MQDTTTPLNAFLSEISEIQDTDYGDYMRKVNHALLTLMDKIYDQSSLQVKEWLDELQFTIQFQPNWDIPSTRRKVSLLVKVLQQQINLESSKKEKRREYSNRNL
ncbi:MAG: hypothetical protein ACXVAX_11020 [Pseudobdellovibrio sp.]